MKKKVEFKGLLHEKPIVAGAVGKLSYHRYYMEHKIELMKHNKMYEARDYTDMRMFDKHPSLLTARDRVLFLTSLSPGFLRSIKLLKNKSKEWKSRQDYKEIRQISKIINKKGIIKFLGLEKESTINYLNKKYGNKAQGIELLISLLKNKYEHKQL